MSNHQSPSGYDQLWSDFLTRVSTMVNSMAFDAWFKPMRLASVERSTVVIDCPTPFHMNWVESHHKDTVCYVLGDLIGGSARVQFTANNGSSEEAVARKFDPPLIAVVKKRNGNSGEPLNPKYLFEEFVQGNNSRMVYAACQAVAENPETAYNPLFIYGGVGLGKTHLMQAIGHQLLAFNDRIKVHYSSAETFVNELITAIRQNKNHEFREKYRNLDALLLDDIQFLGSKERSQEEFFHTFNALYGAKKRIVVTSDRPPQELVAMDERVRSRLLCGLITDIAPPDFETRCAILKKKIEKEKREIPEDVLVYIADNVKSNIRELEGTLVKLLVHASVDDKKISLDFARDVLKEFIDRKPKKPTIATIQKVVAHHYGVPVDSMKSPVRTASYVRPRQVAIYLSRELTTCSLAQIGQLFGGRDHTTVLHAIEKIRECMETDAAVKSTVTQLKNELT